MRINRTRVIAVALLSVAMAMCLFGFSFLVGFNSFFSRADSNNPVIDPTEIPEFEDLYRRVDFGDDDTGEIQIGQNNSAGVTFALREVAYGGGSISSLLSSNPKRGFSSLKAYQNYSYPVFSNDDMRTIVNGGTVTAPVIMLDTDTNNQDSVVVLEILNLTNPPSMPMLMKHNGEDITAYDAENADADYVYAGIETRKEIYEGVDADGNDKYSYITTYSPGAVAYNTLGKTTIRGMFVEEGYYEFQFQIIVVGADNMAKPVNLSFGFYIVNKAHYTRTALGFPRFPLSSRAVGFNELYNYSYGDTYPEVNYDPDYFDVKIDSVQEYEGKDETNPDNNPGKFKFYNVGEYVMTSTLIYTYIDSNNQIHRLPLTRYTSYVSTLNVLGFQMYYGGWHQNPQYSGPLPFFDPEDSTNSSDITYWVQRNSSEKMENTTFISDALLHAQSLVYLIEANAGTANEITPVKTNFPPVNLKGNVNYATGANDGNGNDDATILATVAFHGVGDFEGDVKLWSYSPLEIGRPFTTAGEYVVTVYFKVNNTLCWQVFYFEIVNSIDIKFATKGEVLTLAELANNPLYANTNITILYDGEASLGKYEVPPTIKLERADLGQTTFKPYPSANQNLNDWLNNFELKEGHYRLTVTYGAYGQAQSVAEVVVDGRDAGIITATSNAKSLANIPAEANAAVFGNGKVSLSWGNKLSGVGYKSAYIDFYKIDAVEGVNPNKDLQDQQFTVFSYNLFAASNLSGAVTSSGIYEPIKTENGWMLDESFSELGAGLYKITLEDEIGNETTFILIIDNTTAAFVQNMKSKSNFVNISTDFSVNNPVRIAFGQRKLVALSTNNSPLLTDEHLLALQKLANPFWGEVTKSDGSVVNSISIPFESVEISVNGGLYTAVSATDLRRGFVELTAEDTYYLRVTDVLGNSSEYYIILTYDNSQGMVLAESGAGATDANRNLMEQTDPSANTSLVISSGGMTNRKYVTFSFEQKGAGNEFRVNTIALEFYALTFDKTSPNYPFAKSATNFLQLKYSNNLIYQADSVDEEKTYRIALYNKGEETPLGLYKITRTYFNGGTDKDPQNRDYWFIVDDTGMLKYDPGKYETDLQVSFGSKTAKAEHFDSKQNTLSSNLPADVKGFESKYGKITFIGLEFSSLIPRFSVTNNEITTDLGGGSIRKRLGDMPTTDTKYDLIVADNARNFSVLLTNGSIKELIPQGKVTSANYGTLTMILDTEHGTRATITKNGTEIDITHMEYYNGAYNYVLDPKDLSELKFQFENDPEGFFADVDIDKTTASWTASGTLPNPVNIPGVISTASTSTSTAKSYVYDVLNSYLKNHSINDGDFLTVSVITVDGMTTVYNILFDRATPSYNLNCIKSQDNLLQVLAEKGDYTLPNDYIYGVSNDFKFTVDTTNNPLLETKTITYCEYYGNLQQKGEPVTFRLDSDRTFASIVDLHYNEVKYYLITEQDYAGHQISYFIQLQGEEYDNDISFVGAVSPLGDDLVLGIEMQVRTSSVDQFWGNNQSFMFVCGHDYYLVLGNTASWSIGGVETKNVAKNEAKLIEVLNKWIENGEGEKTEIALYDRIGDVENFAFYSINEQTPKLELEAYTLEGQGVYLKTSNYDALPSILKDPLLIDKFKIEVRDLTDPKNEITVAGVIFNMPSVALHNYGNIQAKSELIITVEDPFGRQTITEFHGQNAGALSFKAYGNTVDVVEANGITYTCIGDDRGVELRFARAVYYMNVYDGNGNKITNISSVIVDDMYIYYFRPSSQADISRYRIEAIGKLSGAVLFEKYFKFDTRMPSISWTNASDQPIELNTTFAGIVNMQVINSDVKLEEEMFGITISYVRTYNDLVEKVTLNANTENFQFDLPGKYTITVRSEIWATRIYEFEIVEVDDALVSVYDDKLKIEASDVLLEYYNPDTQEYEFIKNYIFTCDDPSLIEETYKADGLEVVPSATTKREIVRQSNHDYYDVFTNDKVNALIWCLGIPSLDAYGQPIYTSRIYFATTGVRAQLIDVNNSNVSLIVNGETLVRAQSNYDVYTDLDANGLKVKLSPGNNFDATGVPYNQYLGNSLVVDCYRNGELIKTISYQEEFNIGQYDSGLYEFKVHDLAGNKLMFGEDYELEQYTILNLSKPMILINGINPVNGMIYNDSVEFQIVGLADEILKAYYGEQEFKKYFYIYEMEVKRDGLDITDSSYQRKTSFSWITKGSYEIKLRYIVGDHKYIDGEYKFQIIPSNLPLSELNIPIYADIDITSIKKNSYAIKNYTSLLVDNVLSIGAETDPGRYEITFQTTDEMTGKNLHLVTFNIGYKSTASSYINLSVNGGSTTTSSVKMSYNPYMLYTLRGDVTIYVYCNGVVVDTIVINSRTFDNEGAAFISEDSRSYSDAGLYTFVVYDAENDLVAHNSWTITTAESPMGAIITAIVAGVAGVALLLFIRMRRKMSVK